MPGHDAKSAAPHGPSATHTFDQLAVQHDGLLGQIVGNYHLLALAGEGTSGRVYRARDVRLDRDVAVKLLHAGASRERFEQEARVLARLGIHPGVVDIYTWGEHNGQCYLALEYVPESAASLLSRRPGGLDVDVAVRIGVQCAYALAAAHRQGVVHGDIKPSNILLSGDGDVAKLCDFGLSSLGPETAPHGGTPAYLAPECASGAAATTASDLYSLAASIYALLAGAPPVTEPNAVDAVRAAATGRIRPLAAARQGLPTKLVDTITKALAQDPARRFASADEFASALEKSLEAEKQIEPAQPTGPVRRLVRFAAMSAAIVIAGVVFLLAQSLLPGGGGNAVLLADARMNLNQGKYDAAREGFEKYLNSQPDNPEARYGLGYACLLEGDNERAAQEFSLLGEHAMQDEGKAAVAYMAQGEKARTELEHAANNAPGGYPAVLLAMLDMMAGKFDDAKARLDAVKEDQLHFDWQRRQYLQTLGQIYFKSGKFEDAEAVFARLDTQEPGANASIVSDYAALSRERASASARKDLGEQIARIKALMKDAPQPANLDTWTSRPLRIWIPPVEAAQGLIIQESGLADVLPWRLSKSLLENTDVPITPVERSAEDAILAEQELSGALSNQNEALRLGQVMGARLLLVSKVTRLFNEELLMLTLVDTETTRQTPVGEYKITRNLDLKAWMEQIRSELVAAVAKAYPIRGRLTAQGDKLVLNIGAQLGAKPGMRLHVLPAPDARPLENVEARIAAQVDTTSSAVELNGAPASAVPAEGWLVEEIANDQGPPHAA